MASRLADRRRDHKKAVTHEDALRKREDEVSILRKSKKDDALSKRRQFSEATEASNNTAALLPTPAGLDLPQAAAYVSEALPANTAAMDRALQLLAADHPAQQVDAANYFRRLLSIGGSLISYSACLVKPWPEENAFVQSIPQLVVDSH